MNILRFALLTCLVGSLFLLTGCGCRYRDDTIGVLVSQGGAETDLGQRQQEVFDREIERLSSLEDCPCLPGTPGMEILIQTADRLNKWIQNRPADENWKPDEEFVALENATKGVSETAAEIGRLLKLLRGDEVHDRNGTFIKASESLDEERQRIRQQFDLFESQMRTLGEQSGIMSVDNFLDGVVLLREKFVSLEKIRNLDVSKIQAFVKQLDVEAQMFNHMSGALGRLSSELRTDGMFLHVADVEYLKQSVWIRDVSQWARGNTQQALERVKSLFDWSVCNIDLTRNRNNPFGLNNSVSLQLPIQYPWQTMLQGYGTTWDRAWIFIELLRQQRIDAFLISTPIPSTEPGQEEVQAIWAVGVLLENEVYLFLPMLGLALPGPDGVCLAQDGSLDYKSIATFSQVLENDALLRQLDVSEQSKFPLTSERVRNSVALFPAVPETVSLRMKMVETELSGEQNMVLWTDFREQRRRLKELACFKSIELWKYPFRAKFEQILLSRATTESMALFLTPNPKRRDLPLWQGRVRYFKGRIMGQYSAMTAFQNARIPDRDIMEYRSHAEFRNDPSQEYWLRLVTVDAGYCLGVASFETDSIVAAKDFFLTVERSPHKIWGGGTQYMLGRIAEREKDYSEAVRRFGLAASATGVDGYRLRAQWLQKLTDSPTPATGTKYP